jgi:hypothetical protein
MQVMGIAVRIGDRQQVGGLGVYALEVATATDEVAPPYLTGPEALEAGLVEFGELEPPDVGAVLVTNHAEVPVLLVEGELVIGGDQDRTVNVTLLCPPRSVTVVPVSCVEAGRWGSRRDFAPTGRYAPGSLRSAKVAALADEADDGMDRPSDQARVWEEVDRQQTRHGVASPTSSLGDVHEDLEDRLGRELDSLSATPSQAGVVCTRGDEVVGLDLFDRPSTLARYLRGIVAGHALDAPPAASHRDQIRTVERFLGQVEAAGWRRRPGVGLGDEVRLAGEIVGIGVAMGGRLVHLAAFPAVGVERG